MMVITNKLNIMKILLKYLIVFLITPMFFVGCRQNDDDKQIITIDSVSPKEALAGDHVVIKGKGLNQVLHVLIESDPFVSLPFSQTDDTIEFNLPSNALAGNKDVVLVLKDGNRYVVNDYHIVPGAPIISSVSPGSAPVGTGITVKGSAFVGINKVMLGNVEIPKSVYTVSADQSTIKFNVPSGVTDGYGYITVTTDKGTASSPSLFFIGKEILVENWDGNKFPGLTWTGAYNAYINDQTGILTGPSPIAISGSYYKITSNGTSWGAGNETAALASTFGLTGNAASVIFVADINTNGSPVGTFLRFNQSNGNFYTYNVTATTGWKTVIIRLNKDLGWQYNGDPSSVGPTQTPTPALINQIKIMTAATLGAQINIDNLRFIQL